MGRQKGYYKPQKQKTSTRVPFHIGIVSDEVEERQKEAQKKREEEIEKDRRENKQRRKP